MLLIDSHVHSMHASLMRPVRPRTNTSRGREWRAKRRKTVELWWIIHSWISRALKDGYVVRLHGDAVYCLVKILIILFFPSLTTHFSTVTHICHLEVTAVWAEKMEIVCIWITLWRISLRNPSAFPPLFALSLSSLLFNLMLLLSVTVPLQITGHKTY